MSASEDIKSYLKQIVEGKGSFEPAQVVEKLNQMKDAGKVNNDVKGHLNDVITIDPQLLLLEALSAKKNNALDIILTNQADKQSVQHRASLMVQAVKTNNSEAIRIIAKNDVVNDEVRNASSFLIADAVKSNAAECVAELVNAGYRVDEPGEQNLAPIQIAARDGSVECAKNLIQVGCNLNIRSNLADPPFIEAMNTAVHSNHAGALEVAELLLKAGCNVNELGLDGRCALHATAAEGTLNQVKFLIKTAGVDLNTEAKGSAYCGYTALHMVIQLREAPGIAQELISAGCDVNKVTAEEGLTAMHLSLMAPVGVRDVYAEMLLKSGCRLDIPDNIGNTPLHQCKHPGILAKLVEAAEPNVLKMKNKLGRCPLQAAIDFGFDMAVCAMLDKGADPMITDNAGDTSLHLASRDELSHDDASKNDPSKLLGSLASLPSVMIGFGISLNTYMKLIKKVSDIDTQNKNGETCLHVAINHNCKRIVEALLKADANAFNIYDNNGHNAYDLATSKQGVTPEIICMLEQRQSQHRIPFVNAIDMLNKLMKTVKLDPTLSKREKKTFDSAIMTLITLLKKNLPKDLAMPLEHRTILKKNRGMLIEEMVPSGVIECLASTGMLDEDSVAAINEERGRRKKCEKLLDVILGRGTRAFPAFCKALNDTDQSFILELMQSKVETEIMKNEDATLISNTPRGRPMISEHKEFLRLNRGRLLQQMKSKTSNTLYKKLVSGGVLTDEMVQEIREESSEEKQCERVLDILPTRGRTAFPLFCQVMEQESAESQESKQIMTTTNEKSFDG